MQRAIEIVLQISGLMAGALLDYIMHDYRMTVLQYPKILIRRIADRISWHHGPFGRRAPHVLALTLRDQDRN